MFQDKGFDHRICTCINFHVFELFRWHNCSLPISMSLVHGPPTFGFLWKLSLAESGPCNTTVYLDVNKCTSWKWGK